MQPGKEMHLFCYVDQVKRSQAYLVARRAYFGSVFIKSNPDQGVIIKDIL